MAANDIEELAAALPARLVDAPVGAGMFGAERAEHAFLIGGEFDNVAALTPPFKLVGCTVMHCGPWAKASQPRRSRK